MINPDLIRWYEEDGVRLPSVTSCLMLMPQPSYIQAWQERIGPEEYKKHMEKIYERGTILHLVCENHFRRMNHPIPTDFEYQHYITGFYTFLSKYGQFITPLTDGTYGIEYPVHAPSLGYAGRIDFICKINGIVTLIDWKTGASAKITGEMKDKYYMQASDYVKAYNATHVEQIQRIMIVVLTTARKDGLGEIMEADSNTIEFYYQMSVPYIMEMNIIYNNGFNLGVKQ